MEIIDCNQWLNSSRFYDGFKLKGVITLQRSQSESMQGLCEFVECQKKQYADKRVFHLEWQGHKIWVKQAEVVNYNIWHRLAKGASMLSRKSLFQPTIERDGVRALQREAERLRDYFGQGVQVPEVLAQGDLWIAISDVGQSLTALLKNSAVSQEAKDAIVCAASTQLAQLHQRNMWHGRPVLRDLAWDGKKISFLDLEEDPVPILTPEQCMIRDALIYVHSLFRDLKSDELIWSALHHYRKQAPTIVWELVRKEAMDMGGVYTFLWIMHRYLGKDGKSSYHALHALRTV